MGPTWLSLTQGRGSAILTGVRSQGQGGLGGRGMSCFPSPPVPKFASCWSWVMIYHMFPPCRVHEAGKTRTQAPTAIPPLAWLGLHSLSLSQLPVEPVDLGPVFLLSCRYLSGHQLRGLASSITSRVVHLEAPHKVGQVEKHWVQFARSPD